MGLLSVIQTVWTTQLPVLSQIARLDITDGDLPTLVIQDPTSRLLATFDLDSGFLRPAAARVQAAGDTQEVQLEGRSRSLDAATLTRLEESDAAGNSAQAYLDGSGFSGNLVALHHLQIGTHQYLYVAAGSGTGVSAYRIGTDGGLTLVAELEGAAYLQGVSALDSIVLGGTRFLVTASMHSNGVSVLEVSNNGTLRTVGSFGQDEHLPVHQPSALTLVELGGRAFVLLASYGSASLTVLELDEAGSLQFVDQVSDTLHSRFGQVAALDTITVNGQVLVAVAGSDGGLSLFQMLPDGWLVHRETLTDQLDTALTGVRQLRFATVEGRIELFALSAGDAGLTRLALDLGDLGVSGAQEYGTSGNDVLSAAADGARLRARDGDDILVDGSGADTLWGGSEADLFVFRPDNQSDTIADFNIAEDHIDLSAFALLYDTRGIDMTQITGGAILRWGGEELRVMTGDGSTLELDQISTRMLFNSDHVWMPETLPTVGDTGNDSFIWSRGADTVDGGDGYDTMTYAAAPERAVVDLTNAANNAAAAAGDVLLNIEALIGSSYHDVLTGDGGNNTLSGLQGNDSLVAGAGGDWINPGPGADTVVGGSGSDMVSFSDLTRGVQVNLAAGTAVSNGETNQLIGIEQVTGTIFGDFIQGDSGDNRIRGLGDYDWLVGSGGTDSYDGGNGRDMLSYVYAPAAVTVDLGQGRGLAGQALDDSYTSIERVTGSIYGDLIYGASGEEDFRGLGGYDWFVGSGGGKDRYDGGSGQDTVAYSLALTGVVASLLLGRGSGGDAARDLYTSIENLTGSSLNDVLTGDNGRNVLRGLYGQDQLFGNGGVDRLTGGGSDDYLDGGAGWDYALFSGNRSDYTVTRRGDQTLVDQIAPGGDGTDTLVNIEALQFADGLIFL